MPEKTMPVRHATAADNTAAVDAFMATLAHPYIDVIEALRRVILAADPAIAEGIKWNAPSFRTQEYFATMHLRAKTGVGLILHFGAKARDLPAAGAGVEDPAGLLHWLARDRAQVVFADVAAVHTAMPPLQALLRQWIRCT